MSQSTDKLRDVIDEVLREKALSKEAIDAVQQILAKNEQLEITDENRKKELIDARTVIANLTSENTILRGNEATVNQRNKDVTEREKKADVLDLTVKYEQLRVQDIKSFIDTVFRNTVVRKNVSQSIPMMTPGSSYPTTHSGNETHETREE